MAVKISNQNKWRTWKAFILFLIAAVWIIGGSLLAEYIGIWGTILTQVGLLGTAIVACLINKTPLKEVFPMKKITVRDFFGAVFMWLGGLGIGLSSVYAMGILMPDVYEVVSGGLDGLFSSTTMVLALITVAFLPPICEEAITRGAILSNLRGLKRDWVIILIVGLMFGALHMDPIRFINTAVMGSVCAFLVVKRNNILLASLVHLCNNFLTGGLAILISLFSNDSASQAVDAAETSVSLQQGLASTMVMFFLAPVLLVLGAYLIRRQKEISEGLEKKTKIGAKLAVAIVLSIAILAGGIALNFKYNPEVQKAMDQVTQTAVLVNVN